MRAALETSREKVVAMSAQRRLEMSSNHARDGVDTELIQTVRNRR